MRQWLWISIWGMTLVLAGCAGGGRFSSPQAEGYHAGTPVQCVPFARERSGIVIYGDAGTWWDKAPPRYLRGTLPKPGAVLVLKATKKMPHGHLAVVEDVINDRTINVSHSNWGNDRASRSMVYSRMQAEDVSPANNWSAVRFWNEPHRRFGFPYPAHGFIYP